MKPMVRFLLAAISLALVCPRAFAEGLGELGLDAGNPSSYIGSCIYPENAWGMRAVFPMHQSCYLAYDLPDETKFHGAFVPWRGSAIDNTITLDTQGARLTYTDGVLVRAEENGAQTVFADAIAKSVKESIESVFPKEYVRDMSKGGKGDVWKWDSRLRLWFANPNCAALLFAFAGILLLALALRTRWYFSLGFLLLMGAALYGLMLTRGRAGLLAYMLGALICLVFSGGRSALLRKLVLVLTAVALGFGVMMYTGTTDRFTRNMFQKDDFVAMRFDVGKAALRMFADGPGGWSIGVNPGKTAMLGWYVDDRDRIIRTHLLTIGESGWLLGYGYILIWVMVLAVGLWGAVRLRDPLALALWAPFAFAGFFNPVYKSWELWVLPVLAMIGLVVAVARKRMRMPVLTASALSVGAAAVIAVGLYACGRWLDDGKGPKIRSTGDRVYVKGGEPDIWIAGDPVVLGGWGTPGKEIRQYCAYEPDAAAVGYVEKVEALPDAVGTLVLSGRRAREYFEALKKGENVCRAKRLLLLSPAVGCADVPYKLLQGTTPLWLNGSLVEPYYHFPARKPSWIQTVPGVRFYIPNWMWIVHGFSSGQGY